MNQRTQMKSSEKIEREQLQVTRTRDKPTEGNRKATFFQVVKQQTAQQTPEELLQQPKCNNILELSQHSPITKMDHTIKGVTTPPIHPISQKRNIY